jgi:hypothetical protein
VTINRRTLTLVGIASAFLAACGRRSGHASADGIRARRAQESRALLTQVTDGTKSVGGAPQTANTPPEKDELSPVLQTYPADAPRPEYQAPTDLPPLYATAPNRRRVP